MLSIKTLSTIPKDKFICETESASIHVNLNSWGFEIEQAQEKGTYHIVDQQRLQPACT